MPMMFKDTLLINSNIEEIQRVYEWIETHLSHEVHKKLRNHILLITQEIVTNAIIHGNCLESSKKVIIKFEMNEKEIVISIQDEGKGCPPLPSKEEAEELDYLSEDGRGLKLAVMICKEITVNKNIITVVFEI